MNARQKAKKLKEELDRIKKSPVPTIIKEPEQMIHMRAKVKIEEYYRKTTTPEVELMKCAANKLSNEVLPVIEENMKIDNDNCFVFDFWIRR